MQVSTGLSQFPGSCTERVLDRLDGVRRSGGGWAARCPAHDDRWPSLSIAEGHDGRALLHDHAGCSVDEVASALGFELRDLFPPRDEPARPQPRRTSTAPYALPRVVAEVLLGSDRFSLAWELAKALAGSDPRQARADVVAAWDALQHRGIAPELVLTTASLLRGVALLRYCGSARFEVQDITRAVRRLVSDLERGEAA